MAKTLPRSLLILVLILGAAACQRSRRPPPPQEEEAVPSTTRVDRAFVQQALGHGLELANQPLLSDVDPRAGTEAIIAVHKGNTSYEVAVVRGNRKVLARAPLSGKIIANAKIEAVGPFKQADLWGDGGKTFLMPVDTTVYHRSVCGILAFRYRYNSLSLVGEFSTKCWRKESGGGGGDPFADFEVKREGKQLTIETVEDDGKRIYRWDESHQAFVSD